MDLGHELVQGPCQQIVYLVKALGQEERTLACGQVWLFWLCLLLFISRSLVNKVQHVLRLFCVGIAGLIEAVTHTTVNGISPW